MTTGPTADEHEARPDAVWLYWTDPRRMCEWWGVPLLATAVEGAAA